MKQNSISLRRRHLMITAIAAVAAPAAAFSATAGIAGDARAMNSPGARLGEGDEKMVVSGRILRRDGKPLSGATVEAWHTRSNGVYSMAAGRQQADASLITSTTTDADGRFMLTMTTSAAYTGRSAHIDYRVSHPQHATLTSKLHFVRTRGITDDRVARMQQDYAGVWRTTFGLALA